MIAPKNKVLLQQFIYSIIMSNNYKILQHKEIFFGGGGGGKFRGGGSLGCAEFLVTTYQERYET